MYQPPRQKLKTYDLHPTSIKLIKNGHYWVTNDKFSEKFHPKEKFIIASERSRPFALLIHDPTHKSVRARVWAKKGNYTQMMKGFKNDLVNRMRKAVKKRKDKDILDKRNHFYLVFGEGDEIPGVFIKYFNGEILVEFYMNFWNQYKDFIIQNIVKMVNEVYAKDLTVANVWVQERSKMQSLATCLDPMATYRRVDVDEFGINYKVLIGKHYDCGLYTDMAAIREKLQGHLVNSKSLLNLYSYTGAFSLFAIKQGVEKVTSVDLSEEYLEWLDENIELNSEIEKDRHTSINSSTKEALKSFQDNGKTFDFIIADPPSSSNDGNKRTNALADYQETIPEMEKVLETKGKLLLFLNTHKFSHEKFKNKVKTIIQKNDLPLELKQHFFLSEDCPSKKGFPEGSYLKGILLQKK